jgi:transposase, IS6 family
VSVEVRPLDPNWAEAPGNHFVHLAERQTVQCRGRCRHRPVQYLNNIIEQDHRAAKRRVNAQQGFREFQAARRTIPGYEAIHMMRKGQVRGVSGTDVRRQNQFINKLFGLAA